MEAKVHADKYPIVALLDKKRNYSGVKFLEYLEVMN
jgi:thioredoxin reductase (NADPH)